MRKSIGLSIIIIKIICFLGCKQTVTEIKEVKKSPLKKFQIWESLQSDGWQKTREVAFTYTQDSLLSEEITRRVSGDSLIPQLRTLRYYDDKNLAKVIRAQWKDSTWVSVIKSYFEYESGMIIHRIDSLSQGQTISVRHTDYEYDKASRIKTETTQGSLDGQWVNQEQIIYHYDKRGLAVEKEFPIWKNNTWVNARKMILKYNEEEQHIQSIRYHWKDEEWIENVNYDLQVDSYGTRLSELWSRSNGLERKIFTKVTYEYFK